MDYIQGGDTNMTYNKKMDVIRDLSQDDQILDLFLQILIGIISIQTVIYMTRDTLKTQFIVGWGVQKKLINRDNQKNQTKRKNQLNEFLKP